MSDSLDQKLALELQKVRKVYRLYRKPVHRVLDLLGLCRANSGFFTEHAALDGVSLQIRRGEKVAIIGRNGAGKSTMLKVITRTIQPSSGRAILHGKVSALLQIGTGFHADFTGRQNAYAAMALQGITGREAHQKFEEIVDFAELEEYIDQPMKSYSTGMCARLMFSASIVVTPDILVVDEVLGVGDAYFTHKSFDRMRELCTGHGTTLLLVTHDVYSAMNLCDRFIWIDRGRLCFDGDAKTTVGRYEASIKEQEEDRLRRRAVISLSKGEAKAARVHVLFRSPTGFALPAPLALEQLELSFAEGAGKTLDVAAGNGNWNLLPEGNLGPVDEVQGRRCRSLTIGDSIYHKVEWYVPLADGQLPRELRVRWNYGGDERVDVRIFTDTRKLLGKGEINGAKGWQQSVFDLSGESGGELDAINQTVYGTGAARMTSVSFIGADGQPVLRAPHGEPLTIRLQLEVPGVLKYPDATLVIGFNRPGLPYGGYAYTQRLHLPPGHHHYTVDVKFDAVLLGSGTWMMTTSIGEPDLYDSKHMPYFTLDNRWYHFIARGVELEVASTGMIDQCGCFMIHPARIVAEPSDAADSASAADGSTAAAPPRPSEMNSISNAR